MGGKKNKLTRDSYCNAVGGRGGPFEFRGKKNKPTASGIPKGEEVVRAKGLIGRGRGKRDAFAFWEEKGLSVSPLEGGCSERRGKVPPKGRGGEKLQQ